MGVEFSEEETAELLATRRPAPFRQAGFKTGSSRYLEIDKRPATKPGHIIAGLIRLTKQKTVQLLHRKQLNSPVMNAPDMGHCDLSSFASLRMTNFSFASVFYFIIGGRLGFIR